MGSSLAALLAGSMPNSTPTMAEKAKATSTVHQDTRRGPMGQLGNQEGAAHPRVMPMASPQQA